MEKLLDPEKAQAIQEEIRARVFEKYAELQGIETQKDELKATLDALHEVTHLPTQSIENIANEVIQEYNATTVPTPLSREQFRQIAVPRDMTFEHLERNVEKKKIGFYIHALTYVCVHLPLLYINLRWPVFPWIIFPLFGWGMGLGAHYLTDVHGAVNGLRRKVQNFNGQIHQILLENIPEYRTDAQERMFNGVHRMLITESSPEAITEYIRNVAIQLPDHEVKQVSTQLCAVRQQYAK